ncbi:unnamed protein product [Didymodactylos carnosus]|uniref:Uncharacterized protein n=1 Tax=Didymodactylos carnosus TaxID=1234261 RepID=A0A813PV23_9BILA|nr:unnamed protein product [Didymodactylos carnosus]CAF1089328.1 unnamed protein product [Didymodactylos carnosus]CAF3536751.1 unnamed protein product [Didymodactylos carnosus]CAF3851040.1 unnamed protein product [Didymodactylos carnosus]
MPNYRKNSYLKDSSTSPIKIMSFILPNGNYPPGILPISDLSKVASSNNSNTNTKMKHCSSSPTIRNQANPMTINNNKTSSYHYTNYYNNNHYLSTSYPSSSSIIRHQQTRSHLQKVPTSRTSPTTTIVSRSLPAVPVFYSPKRGDNTYQEPPLDVKDLPKPPVSWYLSDSATSSDNEENTNNNNFDTVSTDNALSMSPLRMSDENEIKKTDDEEEDRQESLSSSTSTLIASDNDNFSRTTKSTRWLFPKSYYSKPTSHYQRPRPSSYNYFKNNYYNHEQHQQYYYKQQRYAYNSGGVGCITVKG